jgi:ATP-dependent exoDNAse (exonuclease V) beta subunit
MKESEVCELEKVYRTTAQTFQAAQMVCEAFTSNEQIETVAKRVLSGKCHGLSEEVRPLRSIGRPPAIRRYKVEAGPDTENAEMHVAGMRTQVEAISSELEDGEKLSDILFLIPTSKSPAYHALLKALDMLDVPRIDFTIKENRNTTPRDHQVRISTFHSSRGVEASIVVLLDLERLAERTRARQQLYIGLTRAVRLAIVLEPDIAVSQLATLLERAAACINAASTHQDFKKNIPVRPVKPPPEAAEPKPTIQKAEPTAEPPVDVVIPPLIDPDIIHIDDTDDEIEVTAVTIQQEAAANNITAVEGSQEQTKQVQPPADTTTERYEPSGFGTSIFAVVTSKKTRGKQINAIYDWTKFVDVTAE